MRVRASFRARKCYHLDALAALAQESGADPAALDLGALSHWLREAALAFDVRRLRDVAWIRAADHARRVQSLARRLAATMADPLAREAMPWDLRDQASRFLPMLTNRALAAEHYALSRRAGLANSGLGPADTMLLGRDLPHIFAAVFGRLRLRGASCDGSTPRERFVAGAAVLLGLPKPTLAAIRKARERARNARNDDLFMLPPRQRA